MFVPSVSGRTDGNTKSFSSAHLLRKQPVNSTSVTVRRASCCSSCASCGRAHTLPDAHAAMPLGSEQET